MSLLNKSCLSDTNSRRPSKPHTERRLRPWNVTVQLGVQQGSRSYTLLPRHPALMGTPVVSEAVYGPARNLGRSSAAVVSAVRPTSCGEQFDNGEGGPGRPYHEIDSSRPFVKLKDARPHSAPYIFGLEYCQPEPNYHFEHRYDLHNLGYTVSDGQDAVDCTRQGGL